MVGEHMRLNPLQSHDAAYLNGEVNHLIGIDEAGRGCLAGPVVAGVCVLSVGFFEEPSAVERSARINDSKKLSSDARQAQFTILEELRDEALLDFEVAHASVDEIAELNILGANRLAMQRAVEGLAGRSSEWCLPEVVLEGPLFEADSSVKLLVDGRPLKPWPYLHEGIVRGDGKSLSIAMASIAAKVSRDLLMRDLAARYPVYHFEQHKGYATKAHREAILTYGPCIEHRELFLRKLLGGKVR